MSVTIEQASVEYKEAQKYVAMMRHCVTGVPALKSSANSTVYLPKIECENQEDRAHNDSKYKRILAQAEYNNVPARTLSSLQGGLNYRPNDYESVPGELQYLIDDIDGDGLSTDELIKIIQSELLQVKYCGLLAEYSDLESLGLDDDTQLTAEQKTSLGLRASIRLYNRESIVNWDYKRIKGKNQLAWVMLREVSLNKDPLEFSCEEVETYLLLALDDDGEYYQRRWVKSSQANGEWSAPIYPERSNGTAFEYIPFEFSIEGDYPKGEIPLALGYLFEIAGLALHRYQMSACYKSALHYMATPRTWSTGWTNTGFELYQKMTGLDHLSVSDDAHWSLPDGAACGILDWKASDTAYRDYFTANAAEIEAQGGTFDVQENSGEQTATAKVINAAEKTSVLSNVQSAAQTSLNKMYTYCADFVAKEVDVNIMLNREFISVKLSPQDQAVLLQAVTQVKISDLEYLRQMKQGGALIGEVDQVAAEIELSGE